MSERVRAGGVDGIAALRFAALHCAALQHRIDAPRACVAARLPPAKFLTSTAERVGTTGLSTRVRCLSSSSRSDPSIQSLQVGSICDRVEVHAFFCATPASPLSLSLCLLRLMHPIRKARRGNHVCIDHDVLIDSRGQSWGGMQSTYRSTPVERVGDGLRGECRTR